MRLQFSVLIGIVAAEICVEPTGNAVTGHIGSVFFCVTAGPEYQKEIWSEISGVINVSIFRCL